MSRDFSSIFLLIKDSNNDLWTLNYDISILQRHFEEVELLSKHHDLLWSYKKIMEVAFKRLFEMKDEGRQEMES